MPRQAPAFSYANCSPPTPTASSASPSPVEGILIDYSKNLVTQETIQLLLRLADEAGLLTAIAAMFSGAKINTTEGPGGSARGAAQPLEPTDPGGAARM